MEAKIGHIMKHFFWVPLIFGLIGYGLVGGLSFWKAFYSSAVLYFVNPASEIDNVWVMLAKITALIVATGVVLSFLKSIYRALDQIIAFPHSDSTAVYTDNEAGEVLEKTLRHGFMARTGDRGRVERAKYHILMFREDADNLNYYVSREKQFDKTNVYILLSQTDSELLGITEKQNVHFFNILEIMARTYWKSNHLYEVRKKKSYKIAFVGYENAGKQLFRYGYLNNIYSLDQRIEYHIWGCNASEGKFLETLNTMNDDRIIVHMEDWNECVDLIATMDRAILTVHEGRMELLQQILYRNGEMELHCYGPSDGGWTKFLTAGNLLEFGKPEDFLVEDEIKQETLYRLGKLFNYDYSLRYAERKAPSDYEEDMNTAWSALDGFKKGSNIARADHYWIEKRIREECPDTPEEDFWRIEHIRWCRFHYINHWTYAEKRDNPSRHHPLLVPYEELSRKEKEKDGIYDETIRAEIDRMIHE